jgi:hypothetical protein
MEDKKPFRTPLSILALVVAAILGWILRAPKAPTSHSIFVDPPTYAATPETQVLSRGKGETANWTLRDKAGNDDITNDLYIEFEKPEVFPKSKAVPGTNPTRYRIPCSGAYCISGPIGPDAVYGEKYKYWQRVDGPAGPQSVDGHMIINR